MNGARVGGKPIKLSWANQKIPGMPDFEMPSLGIFSLFML